MLRTVLDQTVQPLYLPLMRVAVCLDCDVCFALDFHACPACGSETLIPIARFLEPREELAVQTT